jgi:hypothetical protein
MPDSSNTTHDIRSVRAPCPLDIEQLNQLAVRLRDDYVDVRNPALARDLDDAANVASAHAHFRFIIGEVADALPWENPAKRELLTLIGKEG